MDIFLYSYNLVKVAQPKNIMSAHEIPNLSIYQFTLVYGPMVVKRRGGGD